jgi:hypothetical protein
MRPTRWKVALSTLSFGFLAALAPVTLVDEEGFSAATAECTSCCKEMYSKCIKCVEDCVVVEHAYDKGIGSCVSPLSPNPSG